jgi:hypothetical protein
LRTKGFPVLSRFEASPFPAPPRNMQAL